MGFSDLGRLIQLLVVTTTLLKLAYTDAFVCDRGLFGSPLYGDCLAALNQIPFATTPRTADDRRSRALFSEPQYLFPPFANVHNAYRPTPINQLPKIWRYNTCRVAFMSYGRKDGRGLNAVFASSWTAIVEQLKGVITCTLPQRPAGPGGGWVAHTRPRSDVRPVAALYMYAAMSPFEDIINGHMSSGRAIRPPGVRGTYMNDTLT